MGLTATAKGMTKEQEFDCGYVTFGVFRIELALAYDKELGALYEKYYRLRGDLSDAETERLATGFPEGLADFLFAPDCEGGFSPKECRVIYNDIKDIQMNMKGHNYSCVTRKKDAATPFDVDLNEYNMLEHWKEMFLYCAKRRVRLRFS